MKNQKEKKYVFKLLLTYKKQLVLNAILSLLLLVIYMATPILEQRIIDIGILSKNYKVLLKLVLIAALISISGYIIQYIQMHIQTSSI